MMRTNIENKCKYKKLTLHLDFIYDELTCRLQAQCVGPYDVITTQHVRPAGGDSLSPSLSLLG